MVHHLKHGAALRETLTLTDLVCYVSQASLKSYTSGRVRTRRSRWDCHGNRGRPVVPVQNLGSREERMGQGEEHATYSLLLSLLC